MSKRFLIVFLLLMSFTVSVFSQADRRQVRQGNRLFQNEDYSEAEMRFRRSIEQNPQNIKGMFNLGNALYRQGRYDEAAELFQGLAQFAPGETQRAFAYHNLGNSFLQSEKFAESVEAYKNSLRINPDDDQTRFNLAYAMRLLQEQPPQDQQGDGENDQDEDQEKDQDQDQQPQDGEDDRPEPQPRPDQISPQDAERILDALNQKEQKVQEDVKQEQLQRTPARQAREW